MTTGPLTGALRETLALFDGRGTPKTTTDVADRLELSRRSTYDRLDRLVAHGALETMKVGASGRVWWRPPDRSPDGGRPDGSERAVEQSRQRYETLVDHFPNGIVTLFDEDLRYLIAGGELYESFDRSAEAAVSESLFERSTPEEVAILESHYRAALDGESHGFEVEYDGRVLQFWTVPVTDDEGSVFAGMAISQDVTERKRREQESERQRERLAALDDLNHVVRDITHAVIDRSTREEIETTVCDRLAATDSYLFAWIGEVDFTSLTVTPRAASGVEGYLDGITISVDPDDPRGRGATGNALRTGTMQTTRDVSADPRYDQWRERADAVDFQSSAAIPIGHEGMSYGVLNVYSERPDAFEGTEGTVIEQLGAVVGHAITAVERKQALMSGERTELHFLINDVFDALDLPVATDARMTFDRAVPVGDDEFLIFGSVAAEAVEALEGMCDDLPHWEELAVRRRPSGVGQFRLRVRDSPVISGVAGRGGSVERMVIKDGDLRLTICVPPSLDVHHITELIETAYPTFELAARRQTERTTMDTARIGEAFAESLTPRQRAVLDAAYFMGFFEWPRDATGEEVAASLGISAPTFHQHIRRVESKLFSTLYDSSSDA